MNKLFITGYNRSGTTLLDKILTNHPELFVASQPFFNLFLQAKKDFLKQNNYNINYALLENYFNRKYSYSYTDLVSFLSEYKPNEDDLNVALSNANDYKGQYRKFNNDEIASINSKSIFAEQLLALWQQMKNIKPSAVVSGSKEILCEEFIPFLLSSGVKCILVIRDPRDVIASMNTGKGYEYTGDIKPTLFNIRNWRKSVAFGIEMSGNENFMQIKYEDLITSPETILNKIASFLEVSSYKLDYIKQGIKDEYGNEWKGNSSFAEFNFIDASSAGGYKEKLSKTAIEYIESFCFHEMKYLNYTTDYFENKQLEVSELLNQKDDYLSLVNQKENFSEYFDEILQAQIEIQRHVAIVNNEAIASYANFFLSQEHLKALHLQKEFKNQ
jgi:hypothetical protein